ARNLPSIDYHRNAAWLQLAALATSLTAWLRHLALDGDLAKATTKTLRFRLGIRAGPPRHPCQTQDPESPTRLGLGPRLRHRLGPTPSPAPRLTHPPPPRPPAPPGRTVEPGAHPSTIGPIAIPKSAICADHTPESRRS
ncbi:MAG: hypothetical protein LC749_10635, partial [Actinobacteria bacterium]|nr:hypothetical protein [Actinomycetota bacterium]